jgi:flavin reductase (DIM6/NTAB) family NADH-FMN oxidoreductase RutF
MEWDFDALAPAQRYKLLVGLVVPRPIAWVTTKSPGGLVNAAPFSFFNVLSDDPPLMMISVDNREAGPMKDTARNILDTREFVVNMVDESTLEMMHATSDPYPPEVSEPMELKLELAPSLAVAPPRLAASPVSFECRLHTHLDMGERHLLIGRVHRLHTHAGIIDPATLRVHMDAYHPIGRLFANRYVKTREQLAVAPNAYNQARLKAGRL